MWNGTDLDNIFLKRRVLPIGFWVFGNGDKRRRFLYLLFQHLYVLLTGGIAPRKIRVDGPHILLRTTSSDHRCFQEDRIPPSPISWSFFDRYSSKVMYTTFFISNFWKIIEKNPILNNLNLHIYAMGEGVSLIIYFPFIFRLYWNIIIVFKKVNYPGGGGVRRGREGVLLSTSTCAFDLQL